MSGKNSNKRVRSNGDFFLLTVPLTFFLTLIFSLFFSPLFTGILFLNSIIGQRVSHPFLFTEIIWIIADTVGLHKVTARRCVFRSGYLPDDVFDLVQS